MRKFLTLSLLLMLSVSAFAQNAWGNEAGKIFGTATKIQVEGNCAAFFVRTPI